MHLRRRPQRRRIRQAVRTDRQHDRKNLPGSSREICFPRGAKARERLGVRPVARSVCVSNFPPA